MRAGETERGVAAAFAACASLDLDVDGALVLSNSNRLVVRLTPCDVIARVAVASPEYRVRLATELEVALRLALNSNNPVAGLEPRVDPLSFDRDGFVITLWTHYETVRRMILPADYAEALERLHAGLREIDVTPAHVIDRVAATLRDVASRDVTPDLSDGDRALLAGTLRDLLESIVDRRGAEQLLHGEPHPWNVLGTADGPRFIDFENCARGPVEYDLAWVPEAVGDRYPDLDHDLLGEYRGVVLAIIAMHRWRRDDEHPSGRRSGVAFLDALREGPPWRSLDTVTW